MHDFIELSNNKMEDDGIDGAQDAQNKESDTNADAASSVFFASLGLSKE
jgi:hypothetical protein